MLWVRRFVAALLTRRPNVDSSTMCVRYAVTMWQVFSPSTYFPPVSIIPPMYRTNMFSYMLPNGEKGKEGEVCETTPLQMRRRARRAKSVKLPPPPNGVHFRNSGAFFFFHSLGAFSKQQRSYCYLGRVRPYMSAHPRGSFPLDEFVWKFDICLFWKICVEISLFIKILQK